MNGTTPLYSTETIQPCAGNIAVVWTFPTGTTFNSLRSVMSGQVDGVQTLDFSFTYTTGLTKLPECLPWVVWGTSAGQFTWDADVTVSDMVSEAGNASVGYTDVEAYAPKSQTRMLGNAIAGDYVAPAVQTAPILLVMMGSVKHILPAAAVLLALSRPRPP